MVNKCRVCLRTNFQTYSLSLEAKSLYEQLVNQEIKEILLCYECIGLLYKFSKFKNKCCQNAQFFNTDELSKSKQEDMIINQDLICEAIYNEPFSLGCHSYELKLEDAVKLENFDSSDDIPLSEDVLIVEKKTLDNSKKKYKKKLKDVKNMKLKKRKIKLKSESASNLADDITNFAEILYLSKEEQIEEFNRRSKSLNYLNSSHKCDYCYRGFMCERTFQKHMQKHSDAHGVEKCDICYIRHSSRKTLNAHIMHAHTRRFKCIKCAYVTHTANQAREHENEHRDVFYKCTLCEQTFRKSSTYLSHMRKNHLTGVTCHICGDSFLSEKGLGMHLAKTHALESEYSVTDGHFCEKCQINFVTELAYKRHFVTSGSHSEDYINGCSICGDNFKTAVDLQIHRQTHYKMGNPENASKPLAALICDQCGASFDTKSKCRTHINRVHLNFKYVKQIFCDVCGKEFKYGSALRLHMRTHTNEKPYRCTECGKCFKNSYQLTLHSRTHTTERPYSCMECEKTFRQKPSLNRHMRVHTGARPYICKYCDRSFTQSNTLNVHVKFVHHKTAKNS